MLSVSSRGAFDPNSFLLERDFRAGGIRAMIKVLLVQDNRNDAKQALDMLAKAGGGQIEVTHVERLSTALRRLGRESFDAIMLDSSLIDTHGLNTLNLVQAALARMPIVVLSDQSNEHLERQTIQHGAQDFLVKGQWTAEQLTRAVRHAVERKRAEQNLAYLAQYDPLTTLANRTLFRDRAIHALNMSRRKKQEVGIIRLALDRLADIGETGGPDTGEAFLKAIGQRLSKCTREVDTVARLSGDEFTILLEGINCRGDMEIVANRILEAFGKPFDVGGHAVNVTTSLGLTVYPLDNHGVDELLDHAGIAMNRAKDQGGNAYQFYATSPSSAPSPGGA
ncbi:MAG: diguanylate cyclase domain-containing protein [Nitrospiraceae bacterium]